jgi:hypothetical protein
MSTTSFFRLIVSRFFLFSFILSFFCSLQSVAQRLLMDISLAACLALLQKLFDGGMGKLGYHLKRMHTNIVADSLFVDMQVAWWFTFVLKRRRVV